MKIIAQNKRARHDYEILETQEAGIVLTGLEIKSIRAGQVSLSGSFVKFYINKKGQAEPFVVNMSIGIGEESNRRRKLLLKKNEIKRLRGKVEEKNLTLIVTKLYSKQGLAKLEIALARGLKKYDKRQRLKEKHRRREFE